MLDLDQFAISTKKGIGLPIAGALYWASASIIFRQYPAQRASLYVMVSSGLVFPLGLGITRIFKADLFVKQPPLSNLGGILAAVQAW